MLCHPVSVSSSVSMKRVSMFCIVPLKSAVFEPFVCLIQCHCVEGYVVESANHSVCDTHGLWRLDALPSCQYSLASV